MSKGEPVPNDPDEIISMTHPKVHTSDDIEPGQATRAAFDAVWKDKGWKLVFDAPTATSTRIKES